MSEQDPGPTHRPYGESDPYGQPDPYGQTSPYGQQSPYGQTNPYGQQPGWSSYGEQRDPDRRPGTVTGAAWTTIVLSGLMAAIFGFVALALLVARDQVVAEMSNVPEMRDAGIDPDAAVGLLVAVMAGLVLWALIAIVLAVFVLRRSNVARILLVISAAVTALGSLLSITSGVSAVLLVGAVATIVLLFAGGANDWFRREPALPSGGYPYGQGGGYPYGQQQNPYGQQDQNPYGQQQQNPYGQQDQNPYGQTNPYGQGDQSSDGSDWPPRDYPGR